MKELLLPAGNPEKLTAALRYGADAVYLAGKVFGMRSAAANFSDEELFDAVKYAHSLGKKVYITVNVTPHSHEYDELEKYLYLLKEVSPDALIIADVGVFALAKKILPDTQIHISTQAGAVSHADCSFWHNLGASRVVLARELSFKEIEMIRDKTPAALELECFIHGSMCISWSGRCLLSTNITGRDANRGSCTQPCRWNYNLYEIAEEKRPNLRFPVEETNLGTFIMSSRDMCMIDHVPELMESGISSFKIEGRMKSAYYTAVCANTYRIAMDKYLSSPENYVYDPLWLRELESVSHREYCTGFYFDSPSDNPQTVTRDGYLLEKAYLAHAVAYDEKTGRAMFRQKNKVVSGADIELISPGLVGRPLTALDMQNEKGEAIESAPHPSMLFSIKVPFPVKEGDIIRGV
ncbi:MAG: U32 family peptidase [Clostridia bacterium]|nr:U32 family peptidase [Clostridia bacterium]